jgi:hypothetical protein
MRADVGRDVHSTSSVFVIRDERGKELGRAGCRPRPKGIPHGGFASGYRS